MVSEELDQNGSHGARAHIVGLPFEHACFPVRQRLGEGCGAILHPGRALAAHDDDGRRVEPGPFACRKGRRLLLTRTPWDAEDMAQEALARAFVSLGMMDEAPRHPRAWLFRVANNVWLNRVRRPDERPTENTADTPDPDATAEPRATREAAGTLIAGLSPQERAAVVLKEAFGLSLEEVAESLSTTTGAVKAALHRGRAKLAAPPTPDDVRAPVAPRVLDAFCEAFNARDLDRLTALLLDTTTLEYPGFKIEYGAEAVRAGSLQGTIFGCVDGAHPLEAPARSEVRAHRGESLLLWWSGDEVHAVVRVEIDGDRISRLQNYYHAPEVLTEVCRELGVPFRTHGYGPSADETTDERSSLLVLRSCRRVARRLRAPLHP